MDYDLGKISFFLIKENFNYNDILVDEKLHGSKTTYHSYKFLESASEIEFHYVEKTITKSNPNWLNFINEKLPSKSKISFTSVNNNASGILLIKIGGRVLASCFGTSGYSFLNKKSIVHDFGIITAMNMCGNEALRQTKSRIHSYVTQQIDRQISVPSDSVSFGLAESELIAYISGHLEKNNNITIQGKDNLTLKIIGENKLKWGTLIEYGESFLENYKKRDYKDLFPNYISLESVESDVSDRLDDLLIEKINGQEFSNIHLAIPEFISDDEYSYCYTNHESSPNTVFSNINIEHLSTEIRIVGKWNIEKLNTKYVFAYSSEFDEILEYKKWSLYSCIVSELEYEKQYYILSNGNWLKVDDDFYTKINDFVKKIVNEEAIDSQYCNFDISCKENKTNREDIFNRSYCGKNIRSILFDKAKLKVGGSSKNKEFCDILEYGKKINIIHVKKYGSASSINYLFSQVRFYSEFFIKDDVFLGDIREHIKLSNNTYAADFLDYIKTEIKDIRGADYNVKLWLLYNNLRKSPPNKNSISLMAKYELYNTYKSLIDHMKFNSLTISFVPVKIIDFKTEKKKK